MGYLTNGLTFDTLRQANKARLPTFRNAKGEKAHTTDDGSDWSPAQWLQALVGEVGEFANLRKKYERGDITPEQYAIEAAKELADIQIYLDILARRCLDTSDLVHPTGIDLGHATIKKFNEVSKRVKSHIMIRDDGSDYCFDPEMVAELKNDLVAEGVYEQLRREYDERPRC